jgi:hypothetical protein
MAIIRKTLKSTDTEKNKKSMCFIIALTLLENLYFVCKLFESKTFGIPWKDTNASDIKLLHSLFTKV